MGRDLPGVFLTRTRLTGKLPKTNSAQELSVNC